MCGRKTLTRNMQSIIEELAIDEWNTEDYNPSYNIAPSQSSPVIVGKNHSRIVKTMKWGLIPAWAKDKSIGTKMINARSETLLEKPSFQNLIHHNRCVVIADGYFEWKRENNENSPFYIFHPKHKLLPMAGLWTVWESNYNEIIHSYTVITTTPQKGISHIHNRMPVILNPIAIDGWIFCDDHPQRQVIDYLKPYAEELSTLPVSTYINSPKNNSLECIRGTDDTSTIELF